MEQMRRITRETLIPIGLVLTLFGGVWYLGRLSYNVDSNTQRLSIVEDKVEALPTTREFEALKDELNRRFDGIENLLKKND